MEISKTKGFLLKKIYLANDDAFLEFLTRDFGKISVATKKFCKSQKRCQEVDYFRMLNIEIFEGRKTKSLRSVEATEVFRKFETHKDWAEKGFEWLREIEKIFPEEKATDVFFDFFEKVIFSSSEKDIEKKEKLLKREFLRAQGVLSEKEEKIG